MTDVVRQRVANADELVHRASERRSQLQWRHRFPVDDVQHIVGGDDVSDRVRVVVGVVDSDDECRLSQTVQVQRKQTTRLDAVDVD